MSSLTSTGGPGLAFSENHHLPDSQEFWNYSICLYEIKKKNMSKSTCPTGSFTCPGCRAVGNGEPWRTEEFFAIGLKLMAWPHDPLTDSGLKFVSIRPWPNLVKFMHHPGHIFYVPVLLKGCQHVSLSDVKSECPTRGNFSMNTVRMNTVWLPIWPSGQAPDCTPGTALNLTLWWHMWT